MNHVFNDIKKRMPYCESGEYLDNLIEASTQKAISQQVMTKRNRRWRLSAAAAVALLIVGIGITLFNGRISQQVLMSDQGPLDEFLSSLSDEEAAQLTFYDIEEIPEY